MENSCKTEQRVLRILLVDDEPLLRLQIKSLLDWEAAGFQINAEASDGTEALELLHKFPDAWDILLTDISMPKMGGVELIRQISQEKIPLQIMVLSNYGDYHYVREAFQLGISDYLLKSELSEEKLLKSLAKVRILCQSTIAANAQAGGQVAAAFERGLLAKEQFLHTFYMDALSPDADYPELEKKAAAAGVPTDWKHGFVAVLQIDRYRLLENQSDLISLAKKQTAMRHFIREQEKHLTQGGIFPVSPRQFILLSAMPEENSERIVLEKFTNLLSGVQVSFEQFFNTSLSIGMSSVGKSIRDFYDLGQEAQLCLKLRMIYGLGRLIGPKELAETGVVEEDRPSSQKFAADLVEIFQFAPKEFDERFSGYCAAMQSWLPPDKTQATHYLIALILHLLEQLDQIGVQISDYFEEKINFYDKLMYFETIAEMVRWFADFYRYLYKSWHEAKDSSTVIVREALQYMQEHFREPIRLKVLSQHCHVSESYLSRLFTMVQGETVINYLTKLRLAEARRLLRETNLRITDISLQVGYENQEHFCRIFRRYYSMSPGEYRQSST